MYPDDGGIGYAVPTVYCGGDYRFLNENSSSVDLLEYYIDTFDSRSTLKVPENATLINEDFEMNILQLMVQNDFLTIHWIMEELPIIHV